MPGSLLHRSWEISLTSVDAAEGTAKVNDRTAVINVEEKSDACEVPMKLSNKHGTCAETVEGRHAANGNDLQLTANRTQGRVFASRG